MRKVQIIPHFPSTCCCNHGEKCRLIMFSGVADKKKDMPENG
jgi:hypothetical protein